MEQCSTCGKQGEHVFQYGDGRLGSFAGCALKFNEWLDTEFADSPEFAAWWKADEAASPCLDQ